MFAAGATKHCILYQLKSPRMPIVPASDRLRQECCSSRGVQSHPGQHSSCLKKERKKKKKFFVISPIAARGVQSELYSLIKKGASYMAAPRMYVQGNLQGTGLRLKSQLTCLPHSIWVPHRPHLCTPETRQSACLWGIRCIAGTQMSV